MSELKITGAIKKIFDTQEVSASFKKREFVIETTEQYPQVIKFELTQQKCGDLDRYCEGQEVCVHFNVRGREWRKEGKETAYFNTLQCWKIESVNGATKTAPYENNKVPNDPNAPDGYDPEKLPF